MRTRWREKRAGTEREAEDGEVDLLLLRRVGVGGADEGAAAGLGRWRCARAEPSGGGGEKKVGGAVERRGCAGVERHGVAGGWPWRTGLVAVASRDSTSTVGLPNKKLCRCFL